jgi:hypothetical protein
VAARPLLFAEECPGVGAEVVAPRNCEEQSLRSGRYAPQSAHHHSKDPDSAFQEDRRRLNCGQGIRFKDARECRSANFRGHC